MPSGAVHDDQTRTSILEALKAAFGADKLKGEVAIDANRDVAPWLANLRAALDALKSPNVETIFDGGSVSVGGAIPEADRGKVMSSIKSALAGDRPSTEEVLDTPVRACRAPWRRFLPSAPNRRVPRPGNGSARRRGRSHAASQAA